MTNIYIHFNNNRLSINWTTRFSNFDQVREEDGWKLHNLRSKDESKYIIKPKEHQENKGHNPIRRRNKQISYYQSSGCSKYKMRENKNVCHFNDNYNGRIIDSNIYDHLMELENTNEYQVELDYNVDDLIPKIYTNYKKEHLHRIKNTIESKHNIKCDVLRSKKGRPKESYVSDLPLSYVKVNKQINKYTLDDLINDPEDSDNYNWLLVDVTNNKVVDEDVVKRELLFSEVLFAGTYFKDKHHSHIIFNGSYRPFVCNIKNNGVIIHTFSNAYAIMDEAKRENAINIIMSESDGLHAFYL